MPRQGPSRSSRGAAVDAGRRRRSSRPRPSRQPKASRRGTGPLRSGSRVSPSLDKRSASGCMSMASIGNTSPTFLLPTLRAHCIDRVSTRRSLSRHNKRRPHGQTTTRQFHCLSEPQQATRRQPADVRRPHRHPRRRNRAPPRPLGPRVQEPQDRRTAGHVQRPDRRRYSRRPGQGPGRVHDEGDDPR